MPNLIHLLLNIRLYKRPLDGLAARYSPPVTIIKGGRIVVLGPDVPQLVDNHVFDAGGAALEGVDCLGHLSLHTVTAGHGSVPNVL